MELKPGYKQTEVGVIPSDWEVTSVFSLADKQKARFDDGDWIEAEHITDKGVRLIQTGNIGVGEYVEKDAKKYIYETSFDSLRCKSLEIGDLLICRLAEPAGRACVLPDIGEPKVITSVDVTIYRPSNEKADRGYLVQYFSTPQWFGTVLESAGGTTHKRISRSALGNIQLPVPSLPEQSVIAAALGDVDALLSALDALIAKQRDLKTAAMQQLLTGKTRLPGFVGKWEVKRLGEHLTFIRNGVYSRAELAIEGNVKYLHYGDIHTSSGVRLNPSKNIMPFLPDDKAARLACLKDGDVVFVDATEDLSGVGKSVEIFGLGDTQLVAGLHTIAARFDKQVMADGFKAYLQFIPAFRRHLCSLAAGTKVLSTNRAHITSAELALPRIEEQTAIAEVLSDMDAQLAGLEQQREKTALLKQGMMQELLTGRTRLVQPVAQPASNVVPFPKPEAKPAERKAPVAFVRSVFAAEIVERLHTEPTFGHVKFEKLIYLAEHMCKVDIGANYHRDAAGPYDNRALRSIDSQLKKSKWFEAKKVDGRYQYLPLAKHGGHKPYFDRYFSDVSDLFDKVIDTFKDAKTEQCEIVATLYEAWYDLLVKNAAATDDAIVDQVLNHWHDDKKRISEDRWRKALDWMREKSFVPEGSASEC